MKTICWFALLSAALLTNGCLWKKGQATKTGPAPMAAKTIITPDFSLAAKVISVNDKIRFVVLNFPSNQMPAKAQPLFLYRGGLRVAEVRVTELRDGDNVVADLVSGMAQIGDTVRDQ